MNYFAKIKYLGTDFHGFQVQPEKRTVQGTLCEALSRATGVPCKVTGCSRTDSGVHANEFCIRVDAEGATVPANKLSVAVAKYLPCDLSLYYAEECSKEFHPRYDVKSKEYLYVIKNEAVYDPFEYGRAWFISRPITDEGFCEMTAAAEKFIGKMDFSSFVSEGADTDDFGYGDEAYNEVMDAHVRAAIEVAGAIEAGIIVVHPIHCPTLSAAEQMEWNLEYYRSFEPLCKKWGIKIAIENMWGVRDGKIVPNVCSVGEELGAYLDALASDSFTVCADLGHFPMVGADTAEELRTLGARTGALHIHDNNLIHDWHNIPFSGKMNWDSITSALAETNYKGALTFETDKGYLEPMPTELFFSALKHMAEVGRYLKSQIEQKQ